MQQHFCWLCNSARIHQSASHCLGILNTGLWMQFGDCFFELAHAQLNSLAHTVKIPSHLSSLTPDGLTLNQNKRADMGRLELGPHELDDVRPPSRGYGWTYLDIEGPKARSGSCSSVTLSSWGPDKASRSPRIHWFPHSTSTSQSRSCPPNPPNCHPLRLDLQLSHKLRGRWHHQ